MKKILSFGCILLCLLTAPYLTSAQDYFGPYKVFDIKSVSPNYAIVTCQNRGDYACQFAVKFLPTKGAKVVLLNKMKIDKIAPGMVVDVDYNTKKASLVDLPGTSFSLIQPDIPELCCSITNIEKLTNSFSYFVTISEPATGGLNYFIFPTLMGEIPSISNGTTLYQKKFSDKRYAVIKPGSDGYRFQCFSINYVSNEAYNALGREPAGSYSTGTTNNGNLPATTSPYEVIGTCNSYIPTGSISVLASEDAKCSILITQPSVYTGAFVDSSSTNKVFKVIAGKYDVKISNVAVQLIPVCGGTQTRVKSGELFLNSYSHCSLYDVNKYKDLYDFSSFPQKVAFPIGIYQLNINGIFQQVEIKDGQMLEIDDSTSAPQTQRLSTSSQSWTIIEDPSIKGIGGQVAMQIPSGVTYHTHMVFFSTEDDKKVVASWFGSNKSNLLPGSYNIKVDDKYFIFNVPVEKGKLTRLKMGIFKMNGYGSITIENSDHKQFSYAAPTSILLPEGLYHLVNKPKTPINIKEGVVTEL